MSKCTFGLRRFDEPVDELPNERSSVYSRHHLFWPGADINILGLTDFRGLGCTSARNMDSMVHTLVHMRFSGTMSLRHPSVRADLVRRARNCINRHESHHCGCFNERRLLLIDPLTLELVSHRDFTTLPSCSLLVVDQDIYRLMRDYYATVAPITDTIRTQLGERHDSRSCGCYRYEQNKRIYRPEALRLLPSLAA